MKKIHLNLLGNITHVCIPLRRTAYKAESQFGTQMLPLSDPFSICRAGSPTEQLLKGKRTGWYYRGYSFSSSRLFKKNLKPISFLSHTNLDCPFCQVALQCPFLDPQFPHSQYQREKEWEQVLLQGAFLWHSYCFCIFQWSVLILCQCFSINQYQSDIKFTHGISSKSFL